MAFDILGKQTLWFQVTLMQIGLAMRMTKKVLREDAFMWGIILWLGCVGNNLLYPSPLLRLNTLLLEAVALNCYG
jgi:hypothetical protein